MTSSTRWQLGDVIAWIQTGTEQDAKTDSDIFLTFYDDANTAIAWLHAFERGDLGGFEEGELNCGYLGNLNKKAWLNSLKKSGTRLGIRIENVSDDHPEWFLDYVSLDFRVGPVADNPTARTWTVRDWIIPGAPEVIFPMDPLAPVEVAKFADIGFEKELEIECGAGRNDVV